MWGSCPELPPISDKQSDLRIRSTPLLGQVHWELTSKNRSEHAAWPFRDWGSRGRSLKSRQLDCLKMAVCAGRRPVWVHSAVQRGGVAWGRSGKIRAVSESWVDAVLDALRRDGSIVVAASELDDVGEWRRIVRQACRASGLRVRTGVNARGAVWVYHVDHVVTDAAMQAAARAMRRRFQRRGTSTVSGTRP